MYAIVESTCSRPELPPVYSYLHLLTIFKNYFIFVSNLNRPHCSPLTHHTHHLQKKTPKNRRRDSKLILTQIKSLPSVVITFFFLQLWRPRPKSQCAHTHMYSYEGVCACALISKINKKSKDAQSSLSGVRPSSLPWIQMGVPLVEVLVHVFIGGSKRVDDGIIGRSTW